MTEGTIIRLIVEHPRCVGCLAKKAAVTASEVEETLRHIGSTIVIVGATSLCRDCGSIKQTYTIPARN